MGHTLAVYGTDDTTAVQAAKAQMVTSMGLCSVPPGIYILAGAMVTGTAISAQVLFPGVTVTGQGQVNGFVSQAVTYGVPQSVQIGGDGPSPSDGPIFFSLLTNPGGTNPSVIGWDGTAGPFFGKTLAVMDGVTVRTLPASNVTAVHAFYAAGCEFGTVKGLRVDVLGNAPDIIQPPSGNTKSFGVVMPSSGNWARCRVGWLDVSGYTNNVQLSEHLHADSINSAFTVNAVVLPQGQLGARVDRLCTFSSNHHIIATGGTTPLALSIGQWSIEDDGLTQPGSPAWTATTDHLNAASGNYMDVTCEQLIHCQQVTGVVTTTPTKGGTGAASINFYAARQLIPGGGLRDDNAPRQASIDVFATPKSSVGTWAFIGAVSTSTFGGVGYNFTNAQNDSVTYELYLGGGTYTFDVDYVKVNVGAIISLQVNGITVGTIDTYAAAQANGQKSSITGVVIGGAAVLSITCLAATRNASSTGWTMEINRIVATRTA